MPNSDLLSDVVLERHIHGQLQQSFRVLVARVDSDVEVSVDKVGRDTVYVHAKIHVFVENIRIHHLVRAIKISSANLENGRMLLSWSVGQNGSDRMLTA